MKTLTEKIITQQLLNKIRAFKKLELLVTREIIADIFDRVIQINILVPESKLYSKEDLEKVTLNKKRILNEIYTYIPTSLGETIKLKRGVA
jgi:hypothetical protein